MSSGSWQFLWIYLDYRYNCKRCIMVEWKQLTHAFIGSRLDYCNVLYCSITEGLLSRLQSVQNAAARFVTGLGRLQNITPVLRQLHWLSVCQCVMFKLATLVHLSLPGTCRTCRPVRPTCPASVLQVPVPTCPTTITSIHLLECVFFTQLTYGYVYLVAHTMVTAIAVLLLLVWVCGTVLQLQLRELDILFSHFLNFIEDFFCFRWRESRRFATNC